MKKTLILLLAAMVTFSLVPSCDDEDEIKQEEPTPDPDPDPEPEPEPEPTPEPEVGDPAGADGIIKILTIGNSFSRDAVEQNLWELFDAVGMPSVIGNLYIGGCDLATHYSNSVSGSADYSYRKIVDGNKNTTSNFTLLGGILDEDWDFISLQQASPESGVYSTYNPYLPDLIEYIQANATNEDMRIVFHQTWAYSYDYSSSAYKSYYNSDQLVMYYAIMDAVQQAVADNEAISFVIPSGTAVQNARASYMGDTLNDDGRHLEVVYGRYTAACAWFEKISGIDATTKPYAPGGIEDDILDIITHAAHFAVQNPYEINPMEDWQVAPDIPNGVSASADDLSFTKGGGSMLFSITASDSWTATTPDWATVEPSSGSAGKDIVLSLTIDGNADGAERTGELKFGLNSGAYDGATVTVSQAGSSSEEWYYDDFEWTRPYAESVNQQDVVATNEFGSFSTAYDLESVSLNGITVYDDLLGRGYDIKDHSGNSMQNSVVMPGYILYYCNTQAHLQALHLPKLKVVPAEGTPVWFDLEWCPSTNGSISPDTVTLTVEITNGDVTKTFDATPSTVSKANLFWTNHVFEIEGVTIDENTDICIRPIDTYWNQSGNTSRRYLVNAVKIYTPAQ